MAHPIRVASIPERSSYFEHIGWRGDDVSRMPANATGAWVTRHASEFDLMHLHSGIEADLGREEAEQLGLRLHEAHKPLVYTVHSLEQRPGLEEIQSLLIRRSDLVVTLTDEMKTQIFARDGRNSIVVPHPHVVPLEQLERRHPRRRIPPYTLGVQLSSMDGNAVTEAIVEAVAERVRESACYRARVDVESGGLGSGALPAMLAALERRGQIDLHRHESLDDATLIECAREIDIAVVPSVSGPHCRWIEAFRDLGTAVVSPAVDPLGEQRRSFTYALFQTGTPDRQELRSAIELASSQLRSGGVRPLDAERRVRQRRLIAERHRWLYRDLLRSRTASPGPAGSTSRL